MAAPGFTYVDEPLSLTLRRVAVPIITMGMIGAVLIAFGFRGYRGYSV